MGLATADGVSALTTSDTIENDNGTIAAGTGQALVYTVDGGGTLRIAEAAQPANIAVEGGIDVSGTCALLGSVFPGSEPGFVAILRPSAGVTAVDFSGGYHVGYYFASLSSAGAGWGSGTMGGAGTWMYDGGSENEAGSIQAVGAGAGTYALTSSGRMTASFFGLDVRGAATPGGSFAILGGDISPLPGSDQGPLVFVVVRKATSTVTNATFSGTYAVVGLDFDPMAPASASFAGFVTADGAGALSVKTKTNAGGTISDDPVDNGSTYSVASDGTLTVTTTGGPILTGGITADGRFGFAAGGSLTGDDPQFVLLCRQN